ncbi:MAG: cupin domain-containing protein [Desulfuromonas sp.]|nr:cupin domain-containing protein [Desulfuromonas sp.]
MKQAIIRTAEQEEYLHPDHKLFFVRDVVTAATNQYLSLHRGRIEPNGEILMHSQAQSETIYVLSGEVVCTIGAEESTLGAGSCVVVAPEIARGLKNIADQPAELLIVFAPPRC